jgi:small ligand-binding sensory domain FIST
MPFTAVLSTKADTRGALKECLDQANWNGPVDLATVFFSPHHREDALVIAQTVSGAFKPRCLLGCPGETVVVNEREIENGPALALWLGRWADDMEVSPFHLTVEETSEGLALLGWPDDLPDAQPEDSMMIVLADPYTFPADDFLRQLNEEKPGLRVVGGMASGAREIGENPLLIGEELRLEGAIGVLLRGPAPVRSVVSQGCRPIGRPLVITKARDNVILELGGKTALAQLQLLWQELGPRDRQLMQHGLHVGRVISEYQEAFRRGDFLIRNVMGLDQASGALAITDHVRVGQTVQFHVRDAGAADEDLHALLQMDQRLHETKTAAGLLFSCNGRGSRLFNRPDHDAQAIRTDIGNIPLAGFFAQGEFGPVGGQNFLHGFTASVVLFEERS